MATSFDFAPYRRSTVGFDRLFDVLEGAARLESVDGYPPFDIEQESDDRYRITLAVAGFKPDDIEIVAQNNQLTVAGRKAEDRTERHFVHRGIATRAFERGFQLADFVIVQEASFDNGLLNITLKREIPEAMKPRRIEISGGSNNGVVANDRIDTPRNERDAA